jgi:DNA-binding NarL/FixJ family response regulator
MNPSPAVLKSSGRQIRIGIVEDHEIVRAGIRMLVEREPGFEVLWEASSATEALSFRPQPEPAVILLDINLRSENGLSFLPKLLDRFQSAKVLVLTATEEVEVQLHAVEVGAQGVVMKEQAPDILVRAIRSVDSNEPWIGRALSAAAMAKLTHAPAEKTPLDRDSEKIALLTPREKEVVAIVAKGFNGARIAGELRISEATVRHHITSILSKLELANKLELAVFAFHHGLVRPQSPA